MNVYYKEKSTRVIQPMLDGIFEIGEKGVLAAHLLVDAITSASSGSGAVNATPFSKTREEAGASYTHRLDQLQIGGDAKYSTEDDYVSYFVGGHGLLDLAQKNTAIGFGGGISLDTLTAAGSQEPSQITLACNPADLANQQTSCPLNIYSGYASLSQILSRDMLGGLTYDVSDLRGFQSNPYRLVVTDDGLVPDRYPYCPFRQAFGATLRYYVEQTETTLIGAYLATTSTTGTSTRRRPSCASSSRLAPTPTPASGSGSTRRPRRSFTRPATTPPTRRCSRSCPTTRRCRRSPATRWRPSSASTAASST